MVQYDGSGFCGWQRQSHSPSVQQPVEAALSSVANEPITVVCAGRTDTGVHATNQVIHFDTSAQRTARNWVRGANANLPDGVRLHWAHVVPDQFHARFSAVARTYRYLIVNTPQSPAIMRDYLSWERVPLDVEAMSSGARSFIGDQDFSSVRGANCQAPSPWREIKHIGFFRNGQVITMEITANAFLLHMVRNIAGVLMAVGRGEQKPSWVGELLNRRDRRCAGITAPPGGLYLVSVLYPKQLGIPQLPPGPDILGTNAN
ncbi:MAG: tRNA pseudouridine(38-40) synthase TruA [Porticoccaceae bacterium]|nr:tRNA pseudouridine(38-40) synthase TruA [Porticoccaceae bacterium]